MGPKAQKTALKAGTFRRMLTGDVPLLAALGAPLSAARATSLGVTVLREDATTGNVAVGMFELPALAALDPPKSE